MSDEGLTNGGNDQEPTEQVWNLNSEAPQEFRNKAWRVLGQTRKRDVFMTVRELADSEEPLQGASIARAAMDRPHFASMSTAPDLSDNGDLDALCDLLAGYRIPRLARPEHWYFVPFKSMCNYLVNPFHHPQSEKVQAAIEYVRTNQLCTNPESGPSHDGGNETDAESDLVPFDARSTAAHTYAQLSEHLRCTAPKLTFSEFRPDDFGAGVGKGLVIEGSLIAESMEIAPDCSDFQLKEKLDEVFTKYAEQVAHGKQVFRVGLYQDEDDDEHDKKDARLEAISDNSSFEEFDPNLGRNDITFRWVVQTIFIE